MPFHVVLMLKIKNRNGNNYDYLLHVVEVQTFIGNKFPLHDENILHAGLMNSCDNFSIIQHL